MSDDTQGRIRDRAYEIWTSEGCPDDCQEEHWQRAAREIAAEDRGASGSEPAAAPAAKPEGKRKK